jgi:hypothetical protein
MIIEKTIINDYLRIHPEKVPREDNQTQVMQNDDHTECIKYVLNALKNLKSQMKTFTMVVTNSNN